MGQSAQRHWQPIGCFARIAGRPWCEGWWTVDDAESRLAALLGPEHVLAHDRIGPDFAHDECLTEAGVEPAMVLLPGCTADVAEIMKLATELRVPVTARGAGTGMSGAATPLPGGWVISFERMAEILEIDTVDCMADIEPGVTLTDLDAALEPHGLCYPVYPGEYSASLGGNVATNAGGMRAVKYGVTRHHVVGLEAVLPTGEVIRTGGKIVKTSTGYDLTQLIIGSEGTLAVVTRATVKLVPRPEHRATILAPFGTLDAVMAAVPRIVRSGIGPMLLEYIDFFTMAATAAAAGLDLGIPESVKQSALAYLVVGIESTTSERLEQDSEACAELLADLGAIDVYVLPSGAAQQLITARERAFWVAKAANANDVIDVVVPRSAMAEFIRRVQAIGADCGTGVVGCGHAGDGNVHMAVFQPDPAIRSRVMTEIFSAGMDLGGAISGEHGLGVAKKPYFMALEDPVKIDLMRRIKAAFDPSNILNPGKVFD